MFAFETLSLHNLGISPRSHIIHPNNRYLHGLTYVELVCVFKPLICAICGSW